MANVRPKALIDKISALPLDRIAEVEDFVDFIGHREKVRSLSRMAATASAPAFAVVWSNPEDDAYDAL
jgi:hypothetical protein